MCIRRATAERLLANTWFARKSYRNFQIHHSQVSINIYFMFHISISTQTNSQSHRRTISNICPDHNQLNTFDTKQWLKLVASFRRFSVVVRLSENIFE